MTENTLLEPRLQSTSKHQPFGKAFNACIRPSNCSEVNPVAFEYKEIGIETISGSDVMMGCKDGTH